MAWHGQQHNHGQTQPSPMDDFAAGVMNFNPGHGAGVDHVAPEFRQPGFAFGPFGGGGPWAHRGGWGGWQGPGGRGDWAGRRGRRGRRGHNGEEEGQADGEPEKNNPEEEALMNEKDGSPGTMRDGQDDAPDPPEGVPDDGCAHPHPHPHHHHHGPGMRGRGRCGRGGMRGRHFGHHPPFGPFGPRGPGGPGGSWGFGPFMHAVGDWIQNATQNNNNNNEDGDDANTFTPPLDKFRTENTWVLHLGVPGAKKEDVGVNWDPEKALLSVAGIVHRPGDEEFLQTLVSGERRVGLFRRDIPLEEAKGRDEIDADGISAKMEDGVLVIVVPLVEKEWTEIRKVDIA